MKNFQFCMKVLNSCKTYEQFESCIQWLKKINRHFYFSHDQELEYLRNYETRKIRVGKSSLNR
jgi:hypothetical protein